MQYLCGKQMRTLILALAGCALALPACGGGGGGSDDAVCGDQVCDASETAASCATDCGCGNGVLNPGEDCDDTDLGTATCDSVAQHGGTLACNADCTFDVTGCHPSACGNGVVEPGEECDGADLGGATCSSAGFSAGAVTCGADCKLDVSGCCNDFCAAANTSACDGDTVRDCVMEPTGCLGLELTDCAPDQICAEDGATAACQCVDGCALAGTRRCDGVLAQTCMEQADGCLDWTTDVDCATTTGACAFGPHGPTCVAMATGEDCTDPYPVTAGDNVIAWTAGNADYLISQPSCNTDTLDGPDVVLAYTASVDGIVTYSLDKPASARQVVVVSGAACGTLTQADELSCAADAARHR